MKKYLVAVYGSLRKKQSNYEYHLSNSTYKGTFTTEPEYTMHSLSYYPGLKLNGNTSIVMEVYEVDEKTLTNLNRLEGYHPKENIIINGDWIEYLNYKKIMGNKKENVL